MFRFNHMFRKLLTNSKVSSHPATEGLARWNIDPTEVKWSVEDPIPRGEAWKCAGTGTRRSSDMYGVWQLIAITIR